jgi:hypothetical protein
MRRSPSTRCSWSRPSLPEIDLGGKRIKALGALQNGGYHNCAIDTNDELSCWGGNWAGQLGLGDSTNRGNASGQMGVLPGVVVGTGERAVH